MGGGSGGSGGGSATGGGVATGGGSVSTDIPPMRPPAQPAVQRGAMYRSTPERFNRYYTDPAWTPLATLYVSPTGTGNGSSAGTPASVTAGLAAAQAGTKVIFQRGTYSGCYELDDTKNGTYDQPIVLYAERNNSFAIYARHGVSFWQETTNPNLGSSDNLVLHNLFVTTQSNRQALQFIVDSTRNRVENNLLVAVTISGTTVSANASGLLLEVDSTVSANTYVHNYYVSGQVNGRTPNAMEHVDATFSSTWFQALPTALSNDPHGFTPTATAPFLNLGALVTEAAMDRTGQARAAPTDLGPYELP
jgi:hypothetical protein